jgi:mono/diheme cytochrome c family protein
MTLANWFKVNCVSCHSTVGGTDPNLDGYENAKLGAARSLVRSEAGTMPPGAALAPDNVKILSDWINNGMPKDDVGIPQNQDATSEIQPGSATDPCKS